MPPVDKILDQGEFFPVLTKGSKPRMGRKKSFAAVVSVSPVSSLCHHCLEEKRIVGPYFLIINAYRDPDYVIVFNFI